MTPAICLAIIIHIEARGEPVAGQYAVADVVINRSIRREMSICDVAQERGQFAWQVIEPNETAKRIANDALSRPPQHSADMFYSGARPFWANSLNTVAKIGNHYFVDGRK